MLFQWPRLCDYTRGLGLRMRCPFWRPYLPFGHWWSLSLFPPSPFPPLIWDGCIHPPVICGLSAVSLCVPNERWLIHWCPLMRVWFLVPYRHLYKCELYIHNKPFLQVSLYTYICIYTSTLFWCVLFLSWCICQYICLYVYQQFSITAMIYMLLAFVCLSAPCRIYPGFESSYAISYGVSIQPFALALQISRSVYVFFLGGVSSGGPLCVAAAPFAGMFTLTGGRALGGS